MNAVNPVSSSPVTPAADAGVAEPSMEEILASIRRIIADDASAPRPPSEPDPEPDHAGTLLPPPEPHHASPQDIADIPPVESTPFPVPEMAHPPIEAMAPPPHEPEVVPPIEAVAPPPHEETLEEHGLAVPQPGEDAMMSEATIGLPRHPLAPPEVADQGSADLLHAPAPEADPEPTPEPVLLHDPAPQPEPAHVPPPEGLVSVAAESAVTAAFNTLAASRIVDSSEHLTGLVREMIRPLVKAWVDEHLPGVVERLVVAEIERMARR